MVYIAPGDCGGVPQQTGSKGRDQVRRSFSSASAATGYCLQSKLYAAKGLIRGDVLVDSNGSL